MMRVHVDGTRHVLAAARAAGAQRLVLASTSGTTAVSKDETFVAPRRRRSPRTSSPAGRTTCRRSIRSGWSWASRPGLEVVALNPSLLLGPGDTRGSSTGDVLRFLKRQIPFVPTGGISFVDVRDAAVAFVAAAERGRPGERYLLGGPNWTFATFFGRLERLAKVAGPKLRVPGTWAKFGAGVLESFAEWRGTTPSVDVATVEMSEHFWYLDASKAERELGFKARDPQETLMDTIRDLRARFPM